MFRISLRFLLLVLLTINIHIRTTSLDQAFAVNGDQTPKPPLRRALLIGAWDYSRTTPGEFAVLKMEGQLPGPVADVNLLKQVLTDKLQFKPEEIMVLTKKEETTHDAIIKAFQSYLVEPPAQDGEIIYFHYSGHGSQLPDEDLFDANGKSTNKNLVKDEPDNLDETLVPTDYGINGANEIRDDEINLLISKLMAKHPASVILTFDSCHSGTVVRGGDMARGKSWSQRGDWIGSKPPLKIEPEMQSRIDNGLLDPDAALTENYIAISAAHEKENAREYFDHQKKIVAGRFSSALVRALAEIGKQSSYEDLFERIRGLMASYYSDQHPQLEGDKKKKVFGGTALDPLKYIPVHMNKNRELVLKAGLLHGVTEKSLFALYLPDAENLKNAMPVARAEVESVQPGESILKLRSGFIANLKRDQFPFLKGVEEEHQYGDNRLRLLIENIEALPKEIEIAVRARTLPLVNADLAPGKPWHVRLRATSTVGRSTPSPAMSELVLERSDGSVILQLAADERAPDRIFEALKKEAKWLYARSLENRNPQSPVKVKMRIVPVKCEQRLKSKPVWNGNPRELREGTCVAVEVMNLGERDAYINLLDLSSDGEIVQLWPHRANPITDNFISADEKGKWIFLWSKDKSDPAVIRISKPYGTDIFKIISTEIHMDFSTLATRAASSPLEETVKSAMQGVRSPVSRVPANWYTDEVAFVTVP